MNKILVLVIVSLGLYALPAQAETILEEIERTGILKIGMREDVPPFAYIDRNNNWQGACLGFIEVLRDRILTQLDKRYLNISLYQSTLFSRFTSVEEGIIHLECGPNSIRNTLEEEVTFSIPFFRTGIQFLVRQESADQIDLTDQSITLDLGVLKDSTVEYFLREEYPQSNLILFQGVNSRSRGVNAVREGRLDAFVSEGILLLGERFVAGLQEVDYQIIPKKPLNCEYYGMILPSGDPSWEQLVNQVIEEVVQRKHDQVFAQWFELVDPYLNQIEKYCPY